MFHPVDIWAFTKSGMIYMYDVCELIHFLNKSD